MSAPPLVVRCGAFGDMVMVTTMLRLLHARYGVPVDLVASGDWTPPLLSGEPALGHLQMLSSRTTPYPLCPSQWRLVRWLHSRGRGPVYLCDTDDKIAALLRRAGVHEDDIVHRLPTDDEVDGTTRLWPDRWVSMGQRDPARESGPRYPVDPLEYRLPKLVVTAQAREDLAQLAEERGLRGPVVLFQPGNKRTHKRGAIATRQHPKFWDPRHWAALAHEVHAALPAVDIVLCGSPMEHAVLEEIRMAAGGHARLHNLSRELPVPRLLSLIEGAHSMVSVDTGPAHAAAALGCPLVVLFGNASPNKWRPLGPGTILALGGERGDDSRVSDIQPDAVIGAWKSLLPAHQVRGS